MPTRAQPTICLAGNRGSCILKPVFGHVKKAEAIGCGVVAQLVERLVRNEKVRGSTPLGSTNLTANLGQEEPGIAA